MNKSIVTPWEMRGFEKKYCPSKERERERDWKKKRERDRGVLFRITVVNTISSVSSRVTDSRCQGCVVEMQNKKSSKRYFGSGVDLLATSK